jgi:hypothetical protein
MTLIALWLAVRAGWLSWPLFLTGLGLLFVIVAGLMHSRQTDNKDPSDAAVVDQQQAEIDQLTEDELATQLASASCKFTAGQSIAIVSVRDRDFDETFILKLLGDEARRMAILEQTLSRRGFSVGRMRLIKARGENFFYEKIDEVTAQLGFANADRVLDRCAGTSRDFFGSSNARQFRADALKLSDSFPILSIAQVANACEVAEERLAR